MKYNNINFNKNNFNNWWSWIYRFKFSFLFSKNFPESKIVVLDCFRSGETFSNGNLKSFVILKNLLGFNGVVISGDINDKKLLKSLENNYKFDYIFHQAAISDTTAIEQDIMIKTNVNAYEDLLKLQ